MAFSLLLGQHQLSLISCISSVDSSPNFFFFCHPLFVDETWLHAKNCMPSDVGRINFHIRSNAGIMADNRDTVNQSES